MLRFFDLVFFRSSEFYFKNKNSSAIFVALCIVTAMELLNLETLHSIFCILLQKKFFHSKLVVVVLCILLLVANGFRYNNRDYNILKEEWEKKDDSKRKVLSTLIVLYIAFSIVTCFVLAVYVGNQKW